MVEVFPNPQQVIHEQVERFDRIIICLEEFRQDQEGSLAEIRSSSGLQDI